MEIVAQHLQHEAVVRTLSVERDLFGRSAFNRYYYATFLEVKASLAKLRPQWAGELAHASVPEVLRGKVKKELSRGRNTAQKMNDIAVVALCQKALSATESLAKIMDEGRATRVAADYHPEIPIVFVAVSDFRLNTVGVQTAQTWPHKARILLVAISSAWKQVHA